MIETTEWRPELGQGAPTLGVIYAFRSLDGEVRYVGYTTKSVRRRHAEHRREAAAGRKTPFYDWLRKTPREAYSVVILETVSKSREAIGEAESAWIALFRSTGDRLLNLTDGGLGPRGVKWTEERKAEARRRNLGRKGVSLPGEANPMWGRKHAEKTKARWSAARNGQNAGAANPNFGKFGPDHPSYGHRVSDETRRLLSEQKLGEKNPNYGRSASDETRAKMSAARKGKPMPSSARSAHTRWHINRGVVSDTCRHCVDDAKSSSE